MHWKEIHGVLGDGAMAERYKNGRYLTNISLYFGNDTRYGHSYNGRIIIGLEIYRMMLFSMTLSDF